MKRLFALFLLAAPVFAEPPGNVFPSDYKPLPCAAKNVCTSYDRVDFARYAAVHRHLPLRQEWVDAHWDELVAAFSPICTKIANCMAIRGNTDWVFCTDFMRPDFLATAERYPKGSDDRDQWLMASLMWYFGLDKALIAGHKEAQDCVNAQPAGAPGKLRVWMTPENIGPDFDGSLYVYAVDAESRVPVMASISVEGQTLQPTTDSPNGHPLAFYRFKWPIKFNEKPNADGHRDLVVPNVIVQAPAYETTTFPMPIEVPKAIVEMQPPASELKPGANTVTISAKDAQTGKPVEMRVMFGPAIAGMTNKPITIELQKGKPRPEIWVTSLYNRYSDIVVAK